jgi:hypothetical protein
MTSPLVDDKRTIKSIWFDGGQIGFEVGYSDVTAIVAYEEPGVEAMMPYFKVFIGAHIEARVPAYKVMVVYERPKKEEQA